MQSIDWRVADGDERDAVCAHLHGDADRPRHGLTRPREPRDRWIGEGEGAEGGEETWKKEATGTSNLHVLFSRARKGRRLDERGLGSGTGVAESGGWIGWRMCPVWAKTTKLT